MLENPPGKNARGKSDEALRSEIALLDARDNRGPRPCHYPLFVGHFAFFLIVWRKVPGGGEKNSEIEANRLSQRARR